MTNPLGTKGTTCILLTYELTSQDLVPPYRSRGEVMKVGRTNEGQGWVDLGPTDYLALQTLTMTNPLDFMAIGSQDRPDHRCCLLSIYILSYVIEGYL